MQAAATKGNARGKTGSDAAAVEKAPQDADADNAKKSADDDEDNLLAATKKARKIPRTFKEADVVGPNGIFLLYDRILKADLKFEKGHEAKDVHRYLGIVRQWAKDLFPRGHHEDTLERIGGWGGKSTVKSGLEALRRVEVRRTLLQQQPDIKGLRDEARRALQAAEEAAARRREKRAQASGENLDDGDDDNLAGRKRRDRDDEDDGDDGFGPGDEDDGGPDRGDDDGEYADGAGLSEDDDDVGAGEDAGGAAGGRGYDDDDLAGPGAGRGAKAGKGTKTGSTPAGTTGGGTPAATNDAHGDDGAAGDGDGSQDFEQFASQEED